MTNDERNPKHEKQEAVRCAHVCLVIRVSTFLRISSFVIRASSFVIQVSSLASAVYPTRAFGASRAPATTSETSGVCPALAGFCFARRDKSLAQGRTRLLVRPR